MNEKGGSHSHRGKLRGVIERRQLGVVTRKVMSAQEMMKYGDVVVESSRRAE